MMILFYFILAISCTVTLSCPLGWMKNGTWCFLFSHNQVTWGEATAICEAFDSLLAEPITPAVDNFLIAEATKIENTGRKYWIGGSDIEKEGTFIWTSQQLPFSYTNWITGDPNNANAGEDCVLTNWIGDGAWADGDCEWKEYFICQLEDEEITIG